jgi:GDP/UDP-N,N'-diacetylbacillosamine 2-epimerase (hydrolysing)
VTRRRATQRRVAVVTGTRAEYGLLQPVMGAIAGRRGLHLDVIAVGMHLLPKFGRTVRAIERDGWPIAARVTMQAGDDTLGDAARGLGRGVTGVADALDRLGSDIVVVLGDRIEALAGALAAATSGRVLAHIHGGDVAPGEFDDSIRHAITKLAHVHLAATRSAARRIVRLGERCAHVHVVGAPGLDRLRALRADADVPRRQRGQALMIYHAWGRNADVERKAAAAILAACRAAKLHVTAVYPNSDGGHAGVIAALDAAKSAWPRDALRVVRNLDRDAYLRALIGAEVLVGNSSSGLIEAPFAGTPTVNVGGRQAGREPGGRSIVHVGESRVAIRRGIEAARRMRPRAGGRTVYGDGRAGERIADILAALRIDEDLVRKVITY